MSSQPRSSPPRITVKLSHVWILAIGTRGEIQPCIAVAAALQQRGFKVTFFTSGQRYANFAKCFGLHDVVVIDEDAEETVLKQPKVFQSLARGSMVAFVKEMTNRAKAKTAADYEPLLKQVRVYGPPDLVLSTHLTKYHAWYLAKHYQVPFLSLTTTVPSFYNPERSMLGLPSLPFGLQYYLHRKITSAVYDMERPADKALNGGVLDEYYTQEHFQSEFYNVRKLPELCLVSPEIIKSMYSDGMWAEKAKKHPCVGAAVIGASQEIGLPTIDQYGGQVALGSLISFLIGKPKPVYLGWGSMVCYSPEYMVQWIVGAVRHAGQRAIVLGGFAGLSQDLLENIPRVDPALVEYARENVLFVQQAPHEWLFSRVTAVVHHGGAGTTAAGLRAGLPTVVTPALADQYEYSYAVRELGVGVGFDKPLQRISWKALGEAIKTVVSDSGIAERAAALGERLQKEDGAAKAADYVQQYWDDYCQSGVFAKQFPGTITAVSPSVMALQNRQRSTLLLGLGLAGTAAFAGALAYTILGHQKASSK